MPLQGTRRQKAQILQKAGKGIAGAGQMIEVATDLLDQPRLTDLMTEDSPGPMGMGILARIRARLRRK